MADGIVCRNCGFHNAPGDEFCGSCGTYLGWATAGDAGDAAAGASGAGGSTASDAAGAAGAAGAGAAAGAATSGQAAPTYATTQATGAGMPSQVGYPAAADPGTVTCTNCGTVNPAGRTFCQRCGTRLPESALGVARSARTDVAPSAAAPSGGGRRILLPALLVVGILVVVVAALVFGGVLGGHPAASAPAGGLTAVASESAAPTVPSVTETSTAPPTAPFTPGASLGAESAPPIVLVPTPRLSPAPTAVAPTDTPTATPTEAPTEAPTGTPTAPPTPKPTKTPKPTPTIAPTPSSPPLTHAVCPGDSDEVTAIADPLRQNWRLSSYSFGSHSKFDYLTFHLARVATTNSDIADIAVQPYTPSGAASLGMTVPAGDWVLAIGFFGGTHGFHANQTFGFKSLQQAIVETDSGGNLYTMVGANGAGCYQLQIPAWQSSSPQSVNTVDVFLQLPH